MRRLLEPVSLTRNLLGNEKIPLPARMGSGREGAFERSAEHQGARGGGTPGAGLSPPPGGRPARVFAGRV